MCYVPQNGPFSVLINCSPSRASPSRILLWFDSNVDRRLLSLLFKITFTTYLYYSIWDKSRKRLESKSSAQSLDKNSSLHLNRRLKNVFRIRQNIHCNPRSFKLACKPEKYDIIFLGMRAIGWRSSLNKWKEPWTALSLSAGGKVYTRSSKFPAGRRSILLYSKILRFGKNPCVLCEERTLCPLIEICSIGRDPPD